jgi:hypothetical protein
MSPSGPCPELRHRAATTPDEHKQGEEREQEQQGMNGDPADHGEYQQ